MKKEAMDHGKNFWPFTSKDKVTFAQVEELLEEVKKFNAGCIDEYLTNHVDRVYKAWKDKLA